MIELKTIVPWRLKGETEEPGRRPFLGSSSVNTSSPRQRWRHATIRGLREAVLPRRPAPGGQCRCNGTRDTTHPHQQRNDVFCWVRAEAIYEESKHKPVSPSGVSRESAGRQTSPSLRLLWDSRPRLRSGRRRSPHCCKSLRTDAELVVRQVLAKWGPEPWNKKCEGATALEAVTRQPVETQRTKKT
jgi:hypothetical protein